MENTDLLSKSATLLAEAVEKIVAEQQMNPDHVVFKASSGKIQGKGLLWTGADHTKQFIFKDHHKFWSSEDLDLQRTKVYRIDDMPVLSQDRLGVSVIYSDLKTVGVLENLETEGHLNIDGHIFYDGDTQRLGIGTAEPNGLLSLKDVDHEFVINPTNDRKWDFGCWTTAGLNIITDNKARITIDNNGSVTIKHKTVIEGKLGIGLQNFTEDADITTSGPIRIQNKKFEVASQVPIAGQYTKGDVIWNDDPKPSGYVGWICTRSGTPGIWKAFGSIQQ